MWPRIAEMVIGGWLAASPLVFGHSDQIRLAMNDYLCAGAIIICAGLSGWRPESYLHLAQIVIALWLLGFGFLASTEALPSLQNNILIALVLMMFAIIPNHVNRPPRSWRTQRFTSSSNS